MPILPILLFPDPLLRRVSKPAKLGETPQAFIEDLIETLYAQRSGIGIAAPQVGESLRIILMDVSPRDSTKKREVMINPVILSNEGKVLCREGCMSLPDYTATVQRAQSVTVVWRDESGTRRKRRFEGIEAICVQHEVDHLNGKLILDRVSCLKTDVLPRRRRT